MAAAATAKGGNRGAITVCVILATLMQALDTTIANVALPYMQGSVSASQDEIDWVLTSYIVAAAIMTPTTGYLAGRFGLKRLFLVSVGGFTIASMLCGMAQSLVQIVLFRVLQGAVRRGAGAAVADGAAQHQSEGAAGLGHGVVGRRGDGRPGSGAGAGRLADGELFAGVTSSTSTCRSAFSAFSAWSPSCPRRRATQRAKLDWFGFGTLSVALGALQIMIDRGEELDWFSSGEIIIEA